MIKTADTILRGECSLYEISFNDFRLLFKHLLDIQNSDDVVIENILKNDIIGNPPIKIIADQYRINIVLFGNEIRDGKKAIDLFYSAPSSNEYCIIV